MQTRNLERIRFVTRHYRDLQGLRSTVPLGGLLIVFGLGESSGGVLRPVVILSLIVGAASLGLLIFSRPYYRRTLGEVERQPSRPLSLLETLLAILLVYLCLFGLPALFHLGEARNNYFLLSVLFLGRWVWLGGRWSTTYYLMLGGLLLGIAAIGPSSALFLQVLVARGMSKLLCGIALVLAGLLDHWQLVKTLGPRVSAADEAEEEAVAEVKR